VTHDQAEAMTLSHRIAVLRAGRLEQVDSPRRIYEHPASTFVAGFFGSPPMNLLDVQRDGSQARLAELTLAAPDGPADLVLGIRPEHLSIVGDGHTASPDARLAATVLAREPHGAETHLELDVEGQSLRARVSGFDAPAPGESVRLSVDPEHVRWFDRETGRAL
jgi:ABC-type sugar transport system ATPase subunit